MAQRSETWERISDWSSCFGNKPAPILLAHPRKSFYPPHHPLLYRERHFHLCHHLPLALCQQTLFAHSPLDFNWNHDDIRSSPHHHGVHRLWHRKSISSQQYHLHLDRIHHHRHLHRAYTPAPHHLFIPSLPSFRGEEGSDGNQIIEKQRQSIFGY